MDEVRELSAMNQIHGILSELQEAERLRVIAWVSAVFVKNQSASVPGASFSSFEEQGTQLTKSLAEKFSEASPSNQAEKVLICAVHLHEINGGTDFASREVNALLRDLGHGIDNITRAFESLVNRRPQLIVQTRKEGRTKQAQKKFRVTEAGLQEYRALAANATA